MPPHAPSPPPHPPGPPPTIPLHPLQRSFKNIDIALFSAGGTISKELGPVAAAAGAIVVDNSSAFRMTDGVPLVIPEARAVFCFPALSPPPASRAY